MGAGTSTPAQGGASTGGGCLSLAAPSGGGSQLRALRQLERKFQKVDRNSDGGISRRELCAALRIEDDLLTRRLFDLLDADGMARANGYWYTICIVVSPCQQPFTRFCRPGDEHLSTKKTRK